MVSEDVTKNELVTDPGKTSTTEGGGEHEGQGGRVLIVDDLPANVRLLAGILKVAGYEVETASSGAEALSKITAQVPDVVLLDVMMPGMDGFEVCRRIKAEASTFFLPVVMVTALQETSDRVNALEAGADDFLTKPVDEVEVVSRVKSLVRVKRQRDDLEHAYSELKRLESLRDSLGLMLVHDLRTPLTTMIAPLEMLRKGQLGSLDSMQQEAVEMCTRGGYRLLALINELLDINKMESGEMRLEKTDIDLGKLVNEALEEVRQLTRGNATEIHIDIPADLPPTHGDDDLLRRVLMNLLANAIKFAPKGGQVNVSAHETQDERGKNSDGQPLRVIQIGVQDNGPGIPEEDQQRIFEKFGQVESRKAGRKTSTGLGLTFCKLAVEAHGGSIWVESQPGQGSTFCFTLPLCK
ncbi:MAG: response regulator [Abitibacteriaceae bacterium]|nr:response regulator [Abditibacteriaceae bacterium]